MVWCSLCNKYQIYQHISPTLLGYLLDKPIMSLSAEPLESLQTYRQIKDRRIESCILILYLKDSFSIYSTCQANDLIGVCVLFKIIYTNRIKIQIDNLKLSLNISAFFHWINVKMNANKLQKVDNIVRTMCENISSPNKSIDYV